MRLFLLPISTRRSLIYCQQGINLSPRQLTWAHNPVEKATAKGSETWLQWEKAESGWKKKVTVYGNKLFQRLPFEEWGLKSVPLLTDERKEEELLGKVKSHVVYPESLLKQEAVQEALRKYGSNEKQRFHQKWFWGSVMGMPLTMPAALVPVVPNLPFIYLVFRAFSHWRARNGSKHIEFLLKNRLFEIRPSSVLDKAYAASSVGFSWGVFQQDLNASKEAITQPKVPTEQMLLSKADGILIADCLQVPELAPEVERAVWQIEREIKARNELEDEKAKLKSVGEDNKKIE